MDFGFKKIGRIVIVLDIGFVLKGVKMYKVDEYWQAFTDYLIYDVHFANDIIDKYPNITADIGQALLEGKIDAMWRFKENCGKELLDFLDGNGFLVQRSIEESCLFLDVME